MNIYLGFLVSLVSGLYTSFWGAFKDSPFEDFKKPTFPRSVYFHAVIFVALYFIPLFQASFAVLKYFQIFFLVMGLERFLAELYKGFFRTEDQSKYFVPSRITFFGKHVQSDILRYLVGTVLVLAVFAVVTIPFPITSFWMFLLVAYATGLLVSLGGAYKDAPFEGFQPLKFQRSGVVLAVCSPLFYFISDPMQPVSLGFLIYMNGGLERFVVEYYKTYIQRTMSGKFRPDLERIQHRVDTREKFHYGAWAIIIGLIVLYIFEL
ncbi:MAG: hypothetical protein HOE48_23390 [Candidatus Latescibacteria bacterium]|jgi:hypothetical protein|nr:hypothetical protein [Candidatus Latescibacterota bacterium]MBT4140876.1 hypothetical protein [Candidatus Latescibacterota bacterium]MBT5830451.1 hypothetical protein [Candidatus Latescibacterota bacterium]